MHEVVEKVLVSQDEIIHKCAELGAKITSDYKALNEVPYVVGLLKGSVPFMAEIIKHIDLDIQIDFMDVSSYQGTKSVGDIRIDKDLDCSVQGLSILLVEDIVDTGRTLKEVKRTLMNKGAKDVKVVSLLDKPDRRVCLLYTSILQVWKEMPFVMPLIAQGQKKYLLKKNQK